MTMILLMVSHKNYYLSANKGFVIFLTSKLIACSIGGFTLKMKSESIAYLLNGSEHIHWILDLKGEMHSLWDLWISGLQKCKGNGYFEVGRASNNFRSGQTNIDFLDGQLPLSVYTSPKKFVGLGGLMSSDWEPVTITLQALSLVEKVEPVQVRFTLSLRDQHSMWMHNGCKVHMDSYMHQMDHVSWSLGLFPRTTSWR
jgi:hypothetical protein